MAAFLNLVAQFHKRDTLRSFILNTTSGKSTKVISAAGTDIKTDIYNYCARFNCVPICTHQSLTTGGRRLIECRIELPQQGIYGVGKGTTFKLAEAGAALRFKIAAEKYQAEHSKGAIIINDSTSLFTGNSKKFFDFYKIIYPKAHIRSNFTVPTDGKSEGRLHRCQLFIDGKPVGDAVDMSNQKSAEALAYLTAAVALKEREPEIFPKFLEACKAGNGDILKPLETIPMEVDEDCVLHMRQTLISARKAGLPDEPHELVSGEEDLENSGFNQFPHLTQSQAKMRNLSMQKAFGAYLRDPRLDKLRRTRAELPINQNSAKVLDLIKNNTYSIIVGATGSGKTTQVPQMILENAISRGEGSSCNIICTQPRRIAATSVARRVADERGEVLQETVGYHIRFLSKPPRSSGSIRFCTTGIILRQLQYSPDMIMDDVSHLIIDEVHEREMNTDCLLMMLKKTMRQRAAAGKATPKVVLMSATMDTKLFASYFNETTAEGVRHDCPALTVPGRTFPVEEKYLPDILEELRTAHAASALRIMNDDKASTDYLQANHSFLLDSSKSKRTAASHVAKDEGLVIDWKRNRKYSSEGDLVDISTEKDEALVPYGLVAATVAHIATKKIEGSVLVFLPGLQDILKVERLLRGSRILGVDFNDPYKFHLHTLHASLAGAQAEVFNPVPPGCRKIILSTNIAETSITIPDVRYVVDTGKVKENHYNQARRFSQLKCIWISKSNSKQRAGRAGRVKNGHYYALFPKERYDSMRVNGIPEMLRIDLQEICLATKAGASQSPIREFLASALEPPSPKAVDLSIENLKALDAITPEEKITPLGRLLASLPVHPTLGKMIVFGVIFRCLDPMVILSAAHSEQGLFIRPQIERRQAYERKLSFGQDSTSDHIAVINAVRKMREQALYGMKRQHEFALQNFIHMNNFKAIETAARQIESVLVEAGIIEHTPHSPHRRFEVGSASLNQYSNKVPLIKALILGGLHPNLAVCKGGKTYRTPGEPLAVPYESDRNKYLILNKESTRYGNLLSYSSMTRSSDDARVLLRETTHSTPLMAVLFGGKIHKDIGSRLVMDRWLGFYVKCADWTAAKTIFEFRKALDRLLSLMHRGLKIKKKAAMEERLSLEDEIVRETFARGLVEILDRDAPVGVSGPGRLAPNDSPSSSISLLEEINQRSQYPKNMYGGLNSVSWR